MRKSKDNRPARAGVTGAFRGLASLLPLLRAEAGRVAVGLCCLLAVDLLQLYLPRVIKHAVDDLTLGQATGESLLHQGFWVLCLAGGVFVFRLAWRPLLMGFARRVERDLRGRLFNHLQSLHLGYFSRMSSGEIITRAGDDLNNIRLAVGIGLVSAVDGTAMAAAAVGFMLYISPLLTLLAVAPMPIIVAATKLLSPRMYQGYTASQATLSLLTGQAKQTLAGIRPAKAFAMEAGEVARFDATGRRLVDINVKLARITGLMFPASVLVTNLSLAVLLGGGGPLAVLGHITTGDFVAFTAYLMMLTWPMMALGWVVSLMQRAGASMARVQEVLKARPEVVDPPNPARLKHDSPISIAARELTFKYPGQESPALRDVSLSAPAGQATAIVGKVASGKSTLLKLLGRLYDPPAGTLLVQGVDVLDLAQADLRAHLVQVPQEAFLFSGSVAENLTLGGPAREPDLWRALEAAKVAEEVAALPKGLDSKLGERARSLSGGQRQRLALARALLLDPSVLLLDDPLSAVDTQTETEILANLVALRQGRTTVVVSHRLASVSFAECIYVLDRGRVVEQGRHAELIKAGGLYQRLFAEQALLARVEGGHGP